MRSIGFLLAWKGGADIIITMDDDVSPAEGSYRRFPEQHAERLLKSPHETPAWRSTISGEFPRGIPYQNIKRKMTTAINIGLWEGVFDYDAVVQLYLGRMVPKNPLQRDEAIQVGRYVPMCGMNLAFRADVIPLMYFLLMGDSWPYDRFGDIWAGIFAKKICDYLGLGVRSGHPHVQHNRMSNVWDNLKKEMPGLRVNEDLWQAVDSVRLTQGTVTGCYKELAAMLPRIMVKGDYWHRLAEAMGIWASLYE